MADKNKMKTLRLERRARHVRKRVFGTAERPRLAVFRSSKQIYAQIIDDVAGKTLVAAASLGEGVLGALKHGGSVAAAKLVGKTIAERAREKGITKVTFDRGGRMYVGRVKALADSARESGLKF